MSDVDNDDDTGEKTPKTLREQNSKLAEANAALLKQVEDLLKTNRSRTIADVLREKKANPKLAKYADRDIEGDVTEAAVEKWLTDEGELFGYKPAGADEVDDEDSDEDEVVVTSQQRISAATSNAPSTPTGWTPEKIRQSNPAQLIAAGLLDPK